MNKKLDDALCRDFPILYQDRNSPSTKSSMCWGFPGDGWEPLIRRLSEKIEAINNANPNNPPIKAVQVKEKFGGLRFYLNIYDPNIEALIQEAETEAARTCEFCGEPGQLRGRGWIRTLCDTCDKKRETEKRQWDND